MKTANTPDKRPRSESAAMLERSRGVLLSQWEELLRLRRAVLKTPDLDDIHDLRVASRRFRAVLGLFAPLTRAGSVDELNKCVRKLTRVLGGLRNIDEALLFFQSRTQLENSDDNRLCILLPEMRTVELALIHKKLKAFDRKHLEQTVLEIAAGLSGGRIKRLKKISLTAYFSGVSAELFQPINDLIATATVPEQRESRHALRIAIKKWRYFFEIISPVMERDYVAVLGRLKEYQTVLGRMNDVAEFCLLCRSLKLSPVEFAHIEKILLAEDQLLLGSFAALIEHKPLTYTFLA